MEPHIIDGRYEVLATIGRGATASVFRARELSNGREVAVKVLNSGTASAYDTIPDKKDEIERFQREARAAGNVSSEHVARTFDAGVDPVSGAHYLVMELLVGEDLRALSRRLGALAPDLALRLVAQTCIGVAHAHAVGVIHRDIKPANLFLTPASKPGALVVKVLDFGIAKIVIDTFVNPGVGGLTQSGITLGTPNFMSPEQIMSPKTVDYRTDVFALGSVLYELLSGRPAHHGYESIGELLVAVVTRPAPPLQKLAPWVEPQIAALVHRAIELDPARRFQEVRDLAAALQPFVRGARISREMLAPLSDEARSRVAARA